MLETETIYPGGNLPKQKYLKRMWRGLAVLLLSILIILVIRSWVIRQNLYHLSQRLAASTLKNRLRSLYLKRSLTRCMIISSS